MKPDPRDRILIPLKEAAAMLSMSRENLYRKINQGVFPEPIKQGRRSFYFQADVESYLAKLKRTLNPKRELS
jgi:predicted DNA-binding transcriptional regulator AlpA